MDGLMDTYKKQDSILTHATKKKWFQNVFACVSSKSNTCSKLGNWKKKSQSVWKG